MLRDAAARYQSTPPIPEMGFFRFTGPSLYRYTIGGAAGPITSGLVGLVGLDSLLPHEETIRDAEDKAAPDLEIRPLLAITRRPLPVLPAVGRASTVRYGSLVHRLVPVRHPGPIDLGALVLADGHHRRRSAIRERGPGADAMTLVVGDGGRGLRAEAFQRRLIGAGPLPRTAREVFEVTEISRPAPRVDGIVWVGPRGSPLLLKPRPEALASVPPALRTIGSAVAVRLLYPLIGMTQDRVEHFSTPAGVRASIGSGDAALLLPRVRIDAVFAAAEAGTLLPPKGSRFRPKPVRGLVVRATGH